MLRSVTIVVATLVAGSACTQNQDFAGRVVGITEGDTVTVLTSDREQIRVRLGEVDAPERFVRASGREVGKTRSGLVEACAC